MNKRFLTLPLLGLMAVAMTGCSDDSIGTVKNGALAVAPNVKIGAVFEQYGGCAKGSQTWDTVKRNDQKYVTFACDDHLFTRAMEIMRARVPINVDAMPLDVKKTTMTFFFKVDPDKNIRIARAERTITWKDNVTKVIPYDQPQAIANEVKPVYKNELNDVASMVNTNAPFILNTTAKMFYQLFTELRTVQQ